MKRKVRVTFDLEVNQHDDMDEDTFRFMIEENGCPGSGIVGAAIDRLIREADSKGVCWGCNVNGSVKVLDATISPT